jgi:acetyl esterase
MTIDPQVEQYLARLQEAGLPPIQALTPAEARANFAASVPPLFGPVDEVAAVDDHLTETGVPVRIYRPFEAPGPVPALVYFHGGGWVVGSADTHDGITRALARRSGCVVASVDYRLAPEHPFPDGLEDAWGSVEWLAANAADLRLDSGRIAVGGDSSGANLAAVVARRARDRRLDLALQLLAYPVTDHSFDTGSYEEFASGYALTREGMRWYWGHYLGAAGGDDPDASPLRAGDLHGVAPAIVLTAGLDPLRDEGEEYARKLEHDGVPVELVRYDGMIHGFLRLPAVLDRAGEALDELAARLAAALV